MRFKAWVVEGYSQIKGSEKELVGGAGIEDLEKIYKCQVTKYLTCPIGELICDIWAYWFLDIIIIH